METKQQKKATRPKEKVADFTHIPKNKTDNGFIRFGNALKQARLDSELSQNQTTHRKHTSR